MVSVGCHVSSRTTEFIIPVVELENITYVQCQQRDAGFVSAKYRQASYTIDFGEETN